MSPQAYPQGRDWDPKTETTLGLEAQARFPGAGIPGQATLGLVTLCFSYPMVWLPSGLFPLVRIFEPRRATLWLATLWFSYPTFRLPSVYPPLARLTGIWRTDFGFRGATLCFGATLRLGYPPIRGYPLFTPRPFPRARPPPTAGYPMVMPVHAVGSSASLWPCSSCFSLVEGWLQLFGSFHQKATQQWTERKYSASNLRFFSVHPAHQASQCSARSVNRVLRFFSSFCAITWPARTLRRFLIEFAKSRGGGATLWFGYPLAWSPLKATGAGGRVACAPVGVHGVHGR